MKIESSIPGVDIRGEDHEGMKGIAQFMRCSKCSEELRISPSHGGKAFPEDFVFKKARQNGWVPQKKGRHVCPQCQNPYEAPMTDAPREMSPKERRQIFREIDDCYDETHSRYVDNFTDNSIAKKLGVPRKWVSDVRDENFGPSGANTEMERVASALGRITTELTDAINACMTAAEKAEKLQGEVNQARADMEKIKAAVGPHRVA